jgi:hypothetical protein
MPSPEFGAGPVDPELQEQPVPTSEITKMTVITITNPNSLNNFLINYTPDYCILQFSYYISQSNKKWYILSSGETFTVLQEARILIR